MRAEDSPPPWRESYWDSRADFMRIRRGGNAPAGPPPFGASRRSADFGRVPGAPRRWTHRGTRAARGSSWRACHGCDWNRSAYNLSAIATSRTASSHAAPRDRSHSSVSERAECAERAESAEGAETPERPGGSRGETRCSSPCSTRFPSPAPGLATANSKPISDTLEQVLLGEKVGFHAFWTVEHHFLEEFSHCSNPEVLYGAIAAQHGEDAHRLRRAARTPKPYNHPVRSAESAAVLDLISDGRVDFGTGRSSTRLELEGFGIHPDDTREMWQEAVETHRRLLDERIHRVRGQALVDDRGAGSSPSPDRIPHPPIFGATGSDSGHQLMGELGLGLCSFSVGRTAGRRGPAHRDLSQSHRGLHESRSARRSTTRTAAFTMVNCAPTVRGEPRDVRGVLHLVPQALCRADRLGRSVARRDEAGARHVRLSCARIADVVESNAMDFLSYDYLKDSNAVLCGTPGRAGRRRASSTRRQAWTSFYAW